MIFIRDSVQNIFRFFARMFLIAAVLGPVFYNVPFRLEQHIRAYFTAMLLTQLRDS